MAFKVTFTNSAMIVLWHFDQDCQWNQSRHFNQFSVLKKLFWNMFTAVDLDANFFDERLWWPLIVWLSSPLFSRFRLETQFKISFVSVAKTKSVSVTFICWFGADRLRPDTFSLVWLFFVLELFFVRPNTVFCSHFLLYGGVTAISRICTHTRLSSLLGNCIFTARVRLPLLLVSTVLCAVFLKDTKKAGSLLGSVHWHIKEKNCSFFALFFVVQSSSLNDF